MTVKMQEKKVGKLMIKNYSLCALTYLIACSSHIHNVHISVVNQSVYIFLHQLVIYQLYNHFFKMITFSSYLALKCPILNFEKPNHVFITIPMDD